LTGATFLSEAIRRCRRIDATSAKRQPREVFSCVIRERKLRAPAAAMDLIARLK
jgi:hypothetical protein